MFTLQNQDILYIFSLVYPKSDNLSFQWRRNLCLGGVQEIHEKYSPSRATNWSLFMARPTLFCGAAHSTGIGLRPPEVSSVQLTTEIQQTQIFSVNTVLIHTVMPSLHHSFWYFWETDSLCCPKLVYFHARFHEKQCTCVKYFSLVSIITFFFGKGIISGVQLHIKSCGLYNGAQVVHAFNM